MQALWEEPSWTSLSVLSFASTHTMSLVSVLQCVDQELRRSLRVWSRVAEVLDGCWAGWRRGVLSIDPRPTINR